MSDVRFPVDWMTYNKCIKPLQIADFLLILFSLFYCLPVIKWAGGFFQFSKAGQEFKMSQAVTSWGFHSVTRVIFPCANSVVMSVTTTPTCLSFLVSSVTWSASPLHSPAPIQPTDTAVGVHPAPHRWSVRLSLSSVPWLSNILCQCLLFNIITCSFRICYISCFVCQ